jgi:hypothetical protein
MATIQPKTDDEIVHSVEDAALSSSKSVEDLKIQCDKHGLTIEFPRGDIVVVDYSRGVFKIMKFNDSAESVPSEQFNIYS